MHIARLTQTRTYKFILHGAAVLRRLRITAVRDHPGKFAPLLDAQLVCGNMLRAQQAHGVKSPGKQPGRHLRQAEYQVDADILRPGFAQKGESAPRGRGVVTPAHPLQYPVVQRLHAHAETVHPEVQKGLHIAGAVLQYVLRIDLDREFLERTASQCAGNAFKSRRRQHRRRTSSDIERICPESRAYLRTARINLAAEFVKIGIQKAGVPPPACDFRVEIAIDAETSAEGDMDIDHLSYLSISSAVPRRDCSV